MSKPLNAENLMATFPYVLGNDKHLAALASPIAEELTKLYNDGNLLSLYARIDELNEGLLDILAYDFKIDWYLYDASIAIKREQIKSHFDVHRHLGTKSAMVRALTDVFASAVVQEWYEYGGSPYAFRLEVEIPKDGVTVEQQQRILANIKYFKNVRSWLDQVNYTRNNSGELKVGAYTAVVKRVEVYPAADER